MDSTPIESEQEYEDKLGRIDQLMDARKDTPEGVELDALVTLVETYEDIHYPME